ncbi:MAG TPA: competence/damage-inducible protein A [Candidatus Aquicultor sp.]|jgi:nicotinamide-nucleotide amidase
MQYHIITVGSELTLGLSINTNAPFIARRLGEEGFSCAQQKSVPDDRTLIADAINDSLADVDAVILTGGLGPTSDDITREAICDAIGCELEFKLELETLIKDRFGERSAGLPEVTFRQAYLPAGAEPIIPTIGSAPGIIFEHNSKLIMALPGVPREMEDMIERAVIPTLSRHFRGQAYYKVLILKTSATSEGTLQETINDIINALPNVTVGIIASPGEIQLQLVAHANDKQTAEANAHAAERRFRERLGEQVFAVDGETLESIVGDLLQRNNLTIAVAESCTGGLISKRITDIPGSSNYFLGGIVSYSNEAKEALVGVSDDTLCEYGAVSEETALAMAQGARKRFGADIGVSVTGIAGPGGEAPGKPVGLVYIGLSDMGINYSSRFVFYGSRDIVRQKSASMALDMVRRHILKAII